MRIRRNYWQHCMLAIALPMIATQTLHAQETTATTQAGALSSSDTSDAASFQLEPGDQLYYKTTGKLNMIGQGKQEDSDFLTSITVLEKNRDKLALYAFTNRTEETSSGITFIDGPRFTFEISTKGVPAQQELDKAGYLGTAFPTLAVETIFGELYSEGKTTGTISLPATMAPVEAEIVTTREGSNLISTVTVNEESSPILTRKTVFDTTKKLPQQFETSMDLKIAVQGTPVEFKINDKTELTEVRKLSAEQLESLRKDLEQAVPIASKLRNLQMSPPAVMTLVISEMRKSLESHPQGEFSSLFAGLNDQIESGGGARQANAVNVKKGEVPADFTATTIDNKPFKLSDQKGKVVLLDFWATWCPPCILQLPHLKEIYEHNKDKNFVLVGLSADENAETLKSFVESENLQWTQIFDNTETTQTVAEQYGVFIRPTTILIDTEGKVREIDLYGKKLEAAISKLLEETK